MPKMRPKEDDGWQDETCVTDFYFREAILDQLSYYFRIIRQMKRTDRDAYKLYSRIGGHIVPEYWLPNEQKLAPAVNKLRPSFGMVFLSTSPKALEHTEKTDTITPKAFYFTKYKDKHGPPGIQATNQKGDLYTMTVFWYDNMPGRGNGERSAPTPFPVIISPDGEVTVLRVLTAKVETVPRKRKNTSRKSKAAHESRYFSLQRRTWDHHWFFQEWAGEHEATPDDYMAKIFCFGMGLYESSQLSTVKVRATKGRVCGCFGVHTLRTPYFFKDRQVTINHRGNRKRIFHIVRTHERLYGNRFLKTVFRFARQHLTSQAKIERLARFLKIKITHVASHFRGERDFLWNGYTVNITVPGWHHTNMMEFDVAALDLETVGPLPPDEGLIGTKKVGRKLRAWEGDGLGGMYPHGRSGKKNSNASV